VIHETKVGIPRLTALLLASAATASLGCPAKADAAADAVVQELVVTARHREENVQNVPATVTAISGDFLAATNTTGIGQLSLLTPSIQFQTVNPRNSQINIRGLGNNVGLANDGLDPGVGFYVDGVYYNRPATATFDLIDIDRVETLNGPQGTLYGKNTTAGAVSVTTRSPTFSPEDSIEVSGGNYGFLQTKASVSGPLWTDKLAGRLSLSTTSRGGFETNIFDGSKINNYNNLTFRGQLLFVPSDVLRVRVVGDYSKQHLHCCSADIDAFWTPPSGANFVTNAQKFGYTPVLGQVDVNAPVKADQETGGASAQADWSLPSAVVTSITAWRYWNWSPASDLLQTGLDDFKQSGIADRQNQFTQELRIASTGSNTVDYLGGLYFFHEQVNAYGVTQYGSQAVFFLVSAALPASILDGVTFNTFSKYKTDSYAAFGQATWHVTPKLSLTGGLRYTSDDKRGSYAGLSSGGAPLTGALAPFAAIRTAFTPNGGFRVSTRDGAWGGHGDVAYQLTDDAMVYASYSRGNRSGGLNLAQLPAGASAVVAPETVDAYEAGIKSRLFDRRLTLNATVFYEKDEKYQAQTIDPVLLKAYLANIPEVRSQGVELNALARPNDAWSAYGSVTYDDAIYAKFPTAPCPVEQPLPTPASCNLNGAQLPGVPRWALSTGFEFHRDLSFGAHTAVGYLGADDSYRSKLNTAATDSVYAELPSRNLVNARLGIRSADRRWDAFLWAKNLGDLRYLTNRAALAPGYIYGLQGEPQTFGVTLRWRN
jgi:iron complex outermembrane receptor protein